MSRLTNPDDLSGFACADLYYKDGQYPQDNPYPVGTNKYLEFSRRMTHLFNQEEMMVDTRQYYSNESKYLKVADLPDERKQYSMTISGIESVEFDDNGRKEIKLALKFQGAKKMMVLNKTNNDVIAAIHGWESDNWIGKQVFIHTVTYNMANGPQKGLKIAMPMETVAMPTEHDPFNQEQGEALGPNTINDDDIPF